MADKKSNAGNYNVGNCNAGNWNVGDSNVGDWNAGDSNVGDCNVGDCNAGNWNVGNRNAGNRNAGNWNVGNWNVGNYNVGYFCTETPCPTFFDRPFSGTWEEAYSLIPYIELPVGCEWVDKNDMTVEEKKANPAHETTGGFLRILSKTIQEAFPIAWAKMDEATKARFLNLPNFNAEKFLACTGVDVRNPKVATEIIVDGVVYVRKV
jgi:hypothetical protein